MRSERDRARSIAALRAEKDDFFRFHPASPLPHEVRLAFRGLVYFPFDLAFVLRAELVRAAAPELFELATSTGQPRGYLRQGHFDFGAGETSGVRGQGSRPSMTAFIASGSYSRRR